MRTALTALALVAGLGGAAAHAAAPGKAELLAVAAKGAAACAQHMPDPQATGEALKSAGLGLRDANGKLRAYVGAANRVAVIITSQRINGTRAKAGCIVAVNGMTAAEAGQLIQPWIKASGAQPIEDFRGNKRWLGRFKGGPVILALDPSADIDFIDGAAIVAVSPN